MIVNHYYETMTSMIIVSALHGVYTSMNVIIVQNCGGIIRLTISYRNALTNLMHINLNFIIKIIKDIVYHIVFLILSEEKSLFDEYNYSALTGVLAVNVY